MIAHTESRKKFAIHGAWATVAVVICLLMILFGSKGHPPAAIFLPLVILVWVAGHAAIWGITWLLARGRGSGRKTSHDTGSWPISLRIAAVATGIVTSAGLFQLVMSGALGKLYPYHYAGLWTTMLVVKLVHALCFAGLLLRKTWSRPLGALLAVGWATLLVLQIAEHLSRGTISNRAELAIAFGIVVMLLAFGLHLTVSDKVKSFLGH